MINNIYSLPEIEFVGGVSETLVFYVYHSQDETEPFGMAGCVANFALMDFVNRTQSPLLSKAMSITTNPAGTDQNVLSVELVPSDTLDLFGKYIYQITIKDSQNRVDIPRQGIIYIHDNINKGFLRT